MNVPDSGSASIFSSSDVEEILRNRGWLLSELSTEQAAWCARAAALLGGHAADRAALEELLALVFHYDAREIVANIDTHVVMSRYAAREAVRQLALLLLEPVPLSTEQFRNIVDQVKANMDIRGRELFHPLRLAIAGRSGEGELDRVALLLDEAAAARFPVGVKTARERIIEFCSALD
jgi:nondiscriminating glutamyl-tRNA synthetase